jgi:hypothetical protein
MGDAEFFGDYIFLNSSGSANFHSTISGPRGKVTIPFAISTNDRVATSIWEVAGGFSLAHGRGGDANFFVGWRQFPITSNLSYTATAGSRIVLTTAGSVRVSPLANDVIFGFNGKLFAGDHWFAPYYIDIGSGANQQTWEGYGGAGYAFNRGQTMQLAFRTLNYNAFPSNSPIQKISLWGPLLDYTFGI